MKKLIISVSLLAMLLALIPLTVGAAGLGSGAEVLSGEVQMIKSGLRGQSLPFTDTDFKKALVSAELAGIKIIELPREDEGTLMLGEKRVKVGESIKRRQISALVFIPSSGEVGEASFRFQPTGTATDSVYECKMRFIDKVNYAPTAGEGAVKSASVITQRGISAYGELGATDPEGDGLEFIIVSYPTLGALSLIDRETGYYRYTPRADNTGEDSFVYVARDEYGNYSEAVTVKLKVTERMSEVVYSDMLENESYNAAVALTAAGIMGGNVIGDGTYFMPDKTVSRAEFVAMAMKTMGIRPDSTLTESFFDDNDEIPKALVGYVATAQRCGIINGAFDGKELKFRPSDPITRYEAAIIMANIKGIQDNSLEAFSPEDDLGAIPVWARAHVGAMCKLGIFDTEKALSGAKDELCRAEVAEYLYKLGGGK